MLSRYVQVPTPTWLLCGGGLTFDFKSSKNIRPCSRVLWNRSRINIYIYVFEQLNIHISTVFAGCSEASNRIKPFLRRGSGHPSADEDLLRHESHSGRSAADDSRHSESRDPPGDSNDTSSSRDLGAVVVEWGGCLVLRATCRCFLFIHHLG